MPGSREYGFLKGLGEGLADIGKMGFAAELQKMRDDRLAKISDQAADKKWARDKELAEMKIGADKDAAELKYERDVDIARISAKAKAAKDSQWKVVKGGKEINAAGMEVEKAYFSNGERLIDIASPEGRVIGALAGRLGMDKAVSLVGLMDNDQLNDYLGRIAPTGGGGEGESGDTSGDVTTGEPGHPIIDAIANRADKAVEGGKTLVKDIAGSDWGQQQAESVAGWRDSMVDNTSHAMETIAGLLSAANNSEIAKYLKYSIANPTKEYSDRPVDSTLPDHSQHIQGLLAQQLGAGPNPSDDQKIIDAIPQTNTRFR